MKTKQKLLLTLLSLCTLHFALSTANAQGTAFTYQGQLSSGGSPIGGNYDFTFALFNTNSTNTGQVGNTLTNLDVGVSNGLFTVTLDFGANFPGASRWLAIGVRTNGGSSFIALNPLQELTPTPYAIYTPNAGSAGTASNVVSGIDITNAVITNSVFGGNGGGLTNLNASQLSSGTISYSVLPGFQSGSNYNVIGGGQGNIISGQWAVIGGGNNNTNTASPGTAATLCGGQNNIITGGNQPVIGGGFGNSANGNYATIPGGIQNVANGTAATASGFENQALTGGAVVAGGGNNIASGLNSSIAGGSANQVTQQGGAIGGGYNNTNTGAYATIPGGYENLASGTNSFSAGSYAHATNGGSFVWSDASSTSPFTSTNNNSFSIRAIGGARFVTGGAGLTLDGNAVLTNSESGVTLGGTFSGNGAGLTDLFASQLASGANNNLFIGAVGGTTTSGQGNTAAGVSAFQDNTTGSFNVAYGQVALTANTTGGQNTAIGEVALYNNITGSSNTAVGTCALQVNTNGWYNTAIGNFALSSCPGGMSNIALGCLAGVALNGKESNNIDIGSAGVAGEHDTIRIGTAGAQTNTIIAGVLNGNGAGLTNLFASQLASGANNNLFIGVVGGTTTSGQGNTAAGVSAFQDNTTGSFNVAYGQVALSANTTGGQNTAIGEVALNNNTTGSSNTAVGTCALQINTNGWYNTAIGNFALSACPGGMSNIALGCLAGLALNGKESNNIDIGNPGVAGENNTIRIGAAGVQTSAFIAGNVGLGGVTAPQQTLSLNGGMNIDQSSLNVGTTANALLFGSGSGEGVGSVRTGGYGDSYGLNFYTDFAKRMTILQNGNVGIGTTNSIYPLEMGSGAYCSAAGVWQNVSDRNVKEDFTSIKPAEVLAKVAALPITQWKYKVEPNGIKHLGPVAQDFYSSFGLGDNDKAIGTVDESGVALAAIQGLNQKLNEKDAEIEKLKKQLDDLSATVKLLAERK